MSLGQEAKSFEPETQSSACTAASDALNNFRVHCLVQDSACDVGGSQVFRLVRGFIRCLERELGMTSSMVDQVFLSCLCMVEW